MAFPGPGAQVYYNEAGEPIGWDYPSDPEPMDDEDYDRRFGARDAQLEEEYETAYEQGKADAEDREPRKDPEGNSPNEDDGYNAGYTDHMDPILRDLYLSLKDMQYELQPDEPPFERKRGEE